MNAAPDWNQAQVALRSVLAAVQTAHATALSAVQSTESAAQLEQQCRELAQAMGHMQPTLAQWLRHGPVPAETTRLLRDTQAQLDGLQQALIRLEAGNQRALGTLFPAEQAQAYARLGGRGTLGTQSPRNGGHTVLKA